MAPRRKSQRRPATGPVGGGFAGALVGLADGTVWPTDLRLLVLRANPLRLVAQNRNGYKFVDLCNLC